MKFSCAQADLAHALKLCASIAQVSNYDPSMRNVSMTTADHSVTFAAANGHSAISLVVRADVSEAGDFATDCKSLSAFVYGGSGDVIFKFLEKTNRISVKRSSGGRLLLAKGIRPPANMPDELPEDAIKLQGRALVPVLSIANLAGSKDPAKSFNAIWLSMADGYIRAAGTDGYRAGYAWELIDDESARGSFFLHKDTALALRRMLVFDDVVDVYKVGNRLVFDTGSGVFAANQFNADAKKAPHSQLVQMGSREPESYFEVDAAAFMKEIKTCVSIFYGTRVKQRITFTADADFSLLAIETNKENELGYMDLSLMAKITNKPKPFILDAYYIKEILEALQQLVDSNLDLTVNDIVVGEIPDAKLVSIRQSGVNAVFMIGVMI